MVCCDQSTAKLLAQGNQTLASGNPMPVKARFSVPLQPAQPVIIAAGKIVHFRRIAQDRFQVGIQFEELKALGPPVLTSMCAAFLMNEANLSESPELPAKTITIPCCLSCNKAQHYSFTNQGPAIPWPLNIFAPLLPASISRGSLHACAAAMLWKSPVAITKPCTNR